MSTMPPLLYQPMRVRAGDGKIEPCLGMADPAFVGYLADDPAELMRLLVASALVDPDPRDYALVVIRWNGLDGPMSVVFPLASEFEQVPP